MAVWYASREDVKRALDSAETARNNAQIDRALDAASRAIEGLTHRKFYPQTATRFFPWPDEGWSSRPWRLWLDDDELISVTSLSSGGTTIASTNYYLEPVNTGPPYTRVEINLGTSSAFSAGSTWQQAISITGVWGYSADEESAGALAAAVSSSTATTVDVSDSNAIGVGTIAKVDSERMLVTEKTMITTGQTLQVALTASQANVTVAVTTGSSFSVGEVILLDSERMLVVDISGNNLTVKRAWDGTVLATHSGSTIYAPRRLTVTRGALGTTASTHSSGASVTRHVVPGPIRQLAVAEALNSLEQETSAYARVVGTGTAQAIGQSMRSTGRIAGGVGLLDLRVNVWTTYGRKARVRVI